MPPPRIVSCLYAALVVTALAPASPATAQNDPIVDQVNRAFELLGFDDGGPPTTDPARIAEGLPLLEAAAAAGEGVAQNALGMAYANGLFGLELDSDKALTLYADAMDSDIVGQVAALNWALTQFAVGDPAIAVPRLEEIYASETEVALGAASTLAQAYAFGTGVAVDLLRAGPLYEAAVQFNPRDSQSHYMLGRGYEAGFFEGGVQPERALMHYQSAADLGDPRGAWKVGMAHLDGAPGFEGGSAEAYAWVLRSAEGGWVQGMISTAVMLATGEGVNQDTGAAAGWYAKAATEGSAHAMRGLGAMHFFEELGRDSDPNLGLALLELSAEGGDEMAPSLLDAAAGERRRVDRDEVERLKAEWREQVVTRE